MGYNARNPGLHSLVWIQLRGTSKKHLPFL
jgi:hypothetical protein